MKVLLISTAKHKYKERVIMPNDHFEVDNEQDAEDLIAIRHAIRPKEGTLHVKRTYTRRDLKAEE